jgi:hypothetical protein
MSESDRRMRRKFKYGISLLDVIAAAAITTALMMLTLQYVGAANNARRALEQRRAALNESENLMEIVFTWDYRQVTAENIVELQRTRMTQSNVKNLPFSVAIERVQQPLEGQRITLLFEGKNPAGGPAAPARLTDWRYRDAETSEP